MTKRKPIGLALQGGGAHGAFTWGVLDAMLEDDRVEIAAISGTSAGAMNAVALADGLECRDENRAREKLDELWAAVGKAALHSPIQRNPISVFFGDWGLESSPTFQAFDAMSRIVSPYEGNPLNLNPLRDILEKVIDFEKVRACERTKVYVCATNVETGRARVFDRRQLTVDMVLASACLPNIHHAVEVDGVPYWDGGFTGNPALFPLRGDAGVSDIVVVQINPVERQGTPRTAREIADRVNEITFNASLLSELRSIDFVRRLIGKGVLTEGEYQTLRLHRIENGEELNPLGASSKLNAEPAFLHHLRDLGRATAFEWLDCNYDLIGEESSFDIREMFQGNAHVLPQ